MNFKTKKILVLAFSDLSRDPRVYRQLLFLTSKSEYKVTVIGFKTANIDNVEFITVSQTIRKSFIERLRNVFYLKTDKYEEYYWSSMIVKFVQEKLLDRHFDLILANDLNTLPLALSLADKSESKVMLDAHEYQPRQFEDRWIFRFLFQDYWNYICCSYLQKTDAMITVCQGIAKEYKNVYDVECGVITNSPFFQKLVPKPSNKNEIRLCHHGSLSRSRELENMILLTDFLDERFSLDLMFIPNDIKYLEELKKLSKSRPKVRFISPVEMRKIPNALNVYDIGLYLLSPNNFNCKMALPNKIFEFIQARLGIAIWPSPEMSHIVNQYSCGLVSDEFTIESMAQSLNALTKSEVLNFKKQSHIAASDLCAEKNRDILLDEISKLLQSNI